MTLSLTRRPKWASISVVLLKRKYCLKMRVSKFILNLKFLCLPKNLKTFMKLHKKTNKKDDSKIGKKKLSKKIK